jgi:hypothetical protein
MHSRRAVIWSTGILGGVVFAAHASFPRVYSWPMIWPVVTGATAFWLVTQNAGAHRLRSGLAAAFVAGLIAGTTAFIGTAISLLVLVHTGLLAQGGVSGGFATSAGILGLAVLAVVVVVVALLGALFALPIRYLQLRQAHS